MQALEHSICALLLLRLVGHNSSSEGMMRSRVERAFWRALYAPQPTQYIRRRHGNASAGCDSGERLLRAGFAVREAVSADDNSDQARDLCHGSGEKRLEGIKARVERTPLGL